MRSQVGAIGRRLLAEVSRRHGDERLAHLRRQRVEEPLRARVRLADALARLRWQRAAVEVPIAPSRRHACAAKGEKMKRERGEVETKRARSPDAEPRAMRPCVAISCVTAQKALSAGSLFALSPLPASCTDADVIPQESSPVAL
eukprot:6181191-Pleurochrysis_carterae.AAC.1